MSRSVRSISGAVLLGWALLPLILIAGCGSSGPHTIPISGKVTYRGKPLTTGEVRYVPDGAGARQARGTLDDNGEFRLTTFRLDDGALPGTYRIAIISLEPHAGEPGRDESQVPGPRQPIPARKSRVPPRYSNADTSELTDTVDDNHPGHREFDLTE